MTELSISGSSPLSPIELEWLCRLICHAEDPQGNYEIALTLVDDEEMKRLNRKYRGKDEPTDVLSFCDTSSSYSTVSQNEIKLLGMPTQKLGDIVIDIKQIERQKGQNSLAGEFRRVFIHGLLHVLGYDHTRIHAAKMMKEKEDHYCDLKQGEI